MRLKTVRTFARTMLASDRLVGVGSTSPRSAISRAASASVSPSSDRRAEGNTRVSVIVPTLPRSLARSASTPNPTSVLKLNAAGKGRGVGERD